MPLLIRTDQIPTRWQDAGASRLHSTVSERHDSADCIRLALINNMPDAALEDTECQFFQLIDAASASLPVQVSLFSLTGLARSERAQPHLASFYSPLPELWNQEFDGVIVTGTEPRHPNLTSEAYWQDLVMLLEWAQENTVSCVLSCLAAHASVLHYDGIARRQLADKCLGIFNSRKSAAHPLTNDITSPIGFPHSRWNEVRKDDLISCGYDILIASEAAGTDLFVKKIKRSLFVHWQSHPEYEACTLLKEYRRDVRRFLTSEREHYPSLPNGCFDKELEQLLEKFRARALAEREEKLILSFPFIEISQSLQNTWRPAAVDFYKNWLQYVACNKVSHSPSYLVRGVAL